jgi:hypothetical protein
MPENKPPRREERAIDFHARNGEPPVPIEYLRAIGTSDGMKAQHRAHIIALAQFYADNGIKTDRGRPLAMRASEQRKADAKRREIEEIRSLIPGNQPPVTTTAPATPTLSATEALLRLYAL